MKMDLSIIILTLDNKRILEECIKSIQQYTTSITYEIIVVDNNSSDGTRHLIRSTYPDIKLIENQKNLGFSRGNNQGLKIAKGRYALVLNDDTYIKEDSFRKIVSFLDENPGIGICGPKLLNPNGSIQRQGSLLSSFKWSAKKPVEAGLVIGACMFIRTAVLSKTGMFDENLFFYNDDLDLCMRAKKAGYKVVYSPIADVYHYGGYTSKKSPNYALIIEGYRGGLYFCKKHYGTVIYSIYRVLLFPFILAMLAANLFNKAMSGAYLEILGIIINEHIISKV